MPTEIDKNSRSASEYTPQLLTKRELANTLKVTTRTIETWVASGRIPAIRISPRCVRFELGAVLNHIRSEFGTTPNM
jgi:excisionase family DNA binding protein